MALISRRALLSSVALVCWSSGMIMRQLFGMVKVSGTDEVMTVSLHNLRGEKLYSIDLNPDV
jgi:hypothetical protein